MATTLTSALVSFHTRLNAKNANSVIEVIVTDSTGSIVAKESNNFGPFAVNTNSGPNPLEVYNQVDKTSPPCTPAARRP
jgi:hypothetical protein